MIRDSRSTATRITAGRLTNKLPKSNYFVRLFVELCEAPITTDEFDMLNQVDQLLYSHILHHMGKLDSLGLSRARYVRGVIVHGYDPSKVKGIADRYIT